MSCWKLGFYCSGYGWLCDICLSSISFHVSGMFIRDIELVWMSLFRSFWLHLRRVRDGLQANKGVYEHRELHLKLVQAFRLVVAGAALWLLGAIHNAFQVYEKTGFRVQVLQKAVSLPCVVASELLLISGVLALQISGRGHKLMVWPMSLSFDLLC